MSSTTLDAPQGICVYVRRDKQDYHVTDATGVRYGHGRTLLDAMQMWAGDVEWLCTMPSDRLGGALLREQKSYRSALKRKAAA